MKILVTGAAGMLGTAMIDHFRGRAEVVATDLVAGYSPAGVTWHLADLLDVAAIERLLRHERPDVVVHAAALVSVDACEKQPELATALHVNVTRAIAETTSLWGARLIYVSTDSVFDGLKVGSYDESDQANPPNIYARTKLEGEIAALQVPQATVLRTNIFGWSRAERTSFAEWVIRGLVLGEHLTMFADVFYSPIHVSHLAALTERVIEKSVSGLHHAGGTLTLTKYDFAIKIAQRFGLSHVGVTPSSVETAGLAARRPKNMELCNERLSSALDLRIPNVDDGIALLKLQYDSGWVAAIKGRPVSSGYHFWSIGA